MRGAVTSLTDRNYNFHPAVNKAGTKTQNTLATDKKKQKQKNIQNMLASTVQCAGNHPEHPSNCTATDKKQNMLAIKKQCPSNA